MLVVAITNKTYYFFIHKSLFCTQTSTNNNAAYNRSCKVQSSESRADVNVIIYFQYQYICRWLHFHYLSQLEKYAGVRCELQPKAMTISNQCRSLLQRSSPLQLQKKGEYVSRHRKVIYCCSPQVVYEIMFEPLRVKSNHMPYSGVNVDVEYLELLVHLETPSPLWASSITVPMYKK